MLVRSADFGFVEHGVALLIGKLVLLDEVVKLIGETRAAAILSAVVVPFDGIVVVFEDVVDAAWLSPRTFFTMAALQPLIFGLLKPLAPVYLTRRVETHLLVLPVGLGDANEIEILLVQILILLLAFLAPSLFAFEPAYPTLFTVFLVLVFLVGNEAFGNLVDGQRCCATFKH